MFKKIIAVAFVALFCSAESTFLKGNPSTITQTPPVMQGIPGLNIKTGNIALSNSQITSIAAADQGIAASLGLSGSSASNNQMNINNSDKATGVLTQVPLNNLILIGGTGL